MSRALFELVNLAPPTLCVDQPVALTTPDRSLLIELLACSLVRDTPDLFRLSNDNFRGQLGTEKEPESWSNEQELH